MDERLRQKLVMAKEHFERHEYDRAEPLLNQIIEKSQSFADVYNMLGMVRHDRGDFVAAKDAFEGAVRANPSYTEALLNLVVVCNDVGDYEGAQAVYDRIRSTAPSPDGGAVQDPYALGKIANMHAQVAKAYADAGFLSEAEHELKKALALRPGFADLHVKLGALLRDLGDLDAACEAFEAACGANANYVAAHVQLGVTRFMQGQKDLAEACFRHALELEPGHKIATMYLRLTSKDT